MTGWEKSRAGMRSFLGIAHGRKRRRAGSLVGQQEAGSGGGSEPQAPPGADISGGMLFSGPSVAM